MDGPSLRREIYSSTAYDARGNVSCQTVPYDEPFYSDPPRNLVWPASPFINTPCVGKSHTTTTYDALNRVATVIAPDGSQTRHFYSILNNVIIAGPYSRIAMHKVVDAQNHVTASMTNARDQLLKVRQYTGVYSSESNYVDSDYRYDALGNLTLVEQRQAHNTSATPALSQSTMTYDVVGRKKAMTDADMGAWSYGYDAAGNLFWQLDANGKKLCFKYDALDRLTNRYQDAGNNCETVETAGDTHLATYTYDTATYGKGQLATVSWGPAPAENKDTFTYDSRGRLKMQTRLIDNRSYTLETTSFDPLNRPLAVKYLNTVNAPTGETITYAYDHEGEDRLWAGASLLVDKVTYNARGQMVRLRRGDALETLFSYYGATGSAGNSNFRLLSIVTPNLLNLQYQYDKVGNITKITDGLLAAGLNTQAFTYDELDRLKTAATPGGAVNAYNHTYAYNQIGNITSYAGTSYQYSETSWDSRCTFWPSPNPPSQSLPHAVRKAGDDYYFCYDNNGNMTGRNDETGNYSQLFDVENRLTSVTKSGAGTTTFAYDAAGQRVKTEKPDGTIVYTPFPNFEEEERALPAVDLKANGADSLQLPAPASYTLSWSTDHATSCTLTRNGTTLKTTNGDGSHNEASMGSGTYTYMVTCANLAGDTATDSVTVTVVATPTPTPPLLTPTVDLKANGADSLQLPAPASYTLSWIAEHVTNCLLKRDDATLTTTSGSGFYDEVNMEVGADPQKLD